MQSTTEDGLAQHWSLTTQDMAEVLRARGTEHRLRCAVQLCTLRATGRFVTDYRRVPAEAVNPLTAQLGLDPLLFLPDPERPATESAQLQRARQHLGWSEFDAAAEQGLRTRLQDPAAEGMTPGPLLAWAEDLLHAARTVLPAASTLERLVASVAAHAVQDLFDSIASGLPEHLRDAILPQAAVLTSCSTRAPAWAARDTALSRSATTTSRCTGVQCRW